MAARIPSTSKKLFQLYPQLKQGVEEAKREIFANFPQQHTKTGYQKSKKALDGVYLNRYYSEPIAPIARHYEPGFQTELEERRAIKRIELRKRGKGPPKKGSGKQKKK